MSTICVALHIVTLGGGTSSPDFATAVAARPLTLDQEDPGNSASSTWRHWRVDNLLLGALGMGLRRNDLDHLKGLIRDLRHWQVVLLHNPLSNGLDNGIFAAICGTGTSTMYSASALSTDANPSRLHPFPCYPINRLPPLPCDHLYPAIILPFLHLLPNYFLHSTHSL